MSACPDPALLTATALAAAYRAGTLSPVTVHEAVQARIERFEPTINALAWYDPDASAAAALASARRFEEGAPLGALDGVPITLKENVARVGRPARAGTAASTPVDPPRDAPIAERVLEAGAVVIGATTMPDWGMLSSGVSSLYGITRSPLDPSLTTGGSSAGAGAAAAAGYGPLHVGTDIGGSIRLPGTWLGIVAHKPSFGRVPLDAPYLGRVAGPMTRTAADAALLMSVISAPDDRDWMALPHNEIDWSVEDADLAGLRVGLWLEAGAGMPCDPAVAAIVERAAQTFAQSGASVEPLRPWLTERMLADIDLFWRVRSWNDVSALPPAQRAQVLPYIEGWARGGERASGLDVLRAYQTVMAMRAATVEATRDYDLVLSPVAPVAAFPAEWPMPWGDDATHGMAHIGFTVPFSMSGQPACSVNAGHLADGRTVGLQVAGRRFDDVGVLRAVAAYEGLRPVDAQPRWPA